MTRQTILVLGVCGFTGRHFIEYFRERDLARSYRVFGVDLRPEGPEGIDYAQGDLTDYAQIAEVLCRTQPTYVLNLAGIFNDPDPQRVIQVNAGISLHLLEAVRRHRPRLEKILLIGSAAEYGACTELPLREDAPTAPVSLYGVSKVTQTIFAQFYWRAFGLNVTLARTFNVVGKYLPSSLSLAAFHAQIRQIERSGEIYVGNLHTRRDYLDITDVVDAYWRLLLQGKSGQIYNVCSGASVRINDLLAHMIRRSGKQIAVKSRDDLYRSNDVVDSFGDNAKLRRETCWQATQDAFAALDKMCES